MILKVPFEQVQNTAARGEVDGKKVNFFLRVGVTESNLEEALKKYTACKTIVGFDYEGSAEALYNLDLPANRIFVTKEVADLGPGIDFIVKAYPDVVRLILKVPDDFVDMRQVGQCCTRFANVRVDGGRLLRLPGVRIGAVDQDDFVKKVPESRVLLACEGDAGIMRSVDYLDVENLEFYEGKISEKKVREARPVKDTLGKLERVSQRKPAPKQRKIPSFVAQETIGGLGNF